MSLAARAHALAYAPLAAWLLGCGGAPAKPPLMANMVQKDVTVEQLRAIDYEYASRFAQIVAASVLDIVEQSDDPKVLDRAYQWRMWAAAEARAAAFDQDPFAGLLELWVLAGQQLQHFAEGGGKDAFADQQERAVTTARQLEQVVREEAASVMTDALFRELSKSVESWIDEHPIEGQLFVRPTARAHLAGLVSVKRQGGLKAVSSIEDTFRDLNDRLEILTVQMPVEVRWHAEYLTNALFEERFEGRADALIEASDDVIGFLRRFEGTLAEQTNALLDGFQRERSAVFEAIGEERAIILEAVSQERASLMAELDEQLLSAAAELDEVGRSLIDHFFLRLVQILVAVGVIALLTVVLTLLVLRKRPRSDN
jgi:hypothetical protein